MARANGCRVSFDPNVPLEVWASPEQARKTILETMALADVVKVSQDELEFLVGTSDPAEACRQMRARGPRLAVITRGPDGCYFNAGSRCGCVPGVAVSAVDTLGADDAFVGGMLAGLASDPETALEEEATFIHVQRFANAVGAMTTTRYGPF